MAGREQSVFNGGPILAAALPTLAPATQPVLDDDAGTGTGMSAGGSDHGMQYDGFAASSSDPIAEGGGGGEQVKAKQKNSRLFVVLFYLILFRDCNQYINMN